MAVTLCGSVPERDGEDPVTPQMTDSVAVSAWRRRMGTDDAKEINKQRAPTSERVNGDVRTYHTMDRMLVRGAGKVLFVALWNALAPRVGSPRDSPRVARRTTHGNAIARARRAFHRPWRNHAEWVFIIRPGNRVAFAYISAEAGDHPSAEAILSALDKLGRKTGGRPQVQASE